MIMSNDKIKLQNQTTNTVNTVSKDDRKLNDSKIFRSIRLTNILRETLPMPVPHARVSKTLNERYFRFKLL